MGWEWSSAREWDGEWDMLAQKELGSCAIDCYGLE